MTALSRIRRSLFAVTLALSTLAATQSWAVDRSIYDPSRIKTPPIGRIPAIRPERVALPNGVVVFLLEEHTLPVVSGQAYVRSSPTLVPADRTGLADIAGEVMRSGGTAAHGGDWLDDRLAAIGATLNTSIDVDLAGAQFRCLSENTSELVALWAEVMRQPAFPDDKIELSKVGMRRAIASRNDELFPLLSRTAVQAVFGKDNPYAREPEYATVEPVSAADCRALHAKLFVPERLVLAVYGDFRTADMKKLLAARFGDWKKSGTPTPVPPEAPRSLKPKLVFAPKDDVTQSGILLAQVGSRADDPDFAAMQVLEQGLGGGFQSRMFNHIRTQRGLAYRTGANAGTEFAQPGVFRAYSLTKSESTMTALDLVREEVRRVTQAPFSPEELDIAKQSVVNGFVFNFEDPSQVLFRSAYYEVLGYPADFLQRYQKALDAVTGQGVLDAARRKITPDAQVAVIVGREKDFDRALETAGLPVERWDVSIPPPPSATAGLKATPEALAKGRAWLQKAADLAGGSAAWSKVKSVTIEQQLTLHIQGQSIPLGVVESTVFPDRQIAVQKLPFGEVKQGYDGKSGWVSAMGKLDDNPKLGDDVRRDWERSLFHLFSNPASLEVQALDEPRTIEGMTCRVALVRSERVTDWLLLFDADGRLAGMEYVGQGPGGGPAKQLQLFSDWKPEAGLQYPRAVKAQVDGKPFIEGTVTALTLNPTLADEVFKKPAN